jgi:hypothetical protein
MRPCARVTEISVRATEPCAPAHPSHEPPLTRMPLDRAASRPMILCQSFYKMTERLLYGTLIIL